MIQKSAMSIATQTKKPKKSKIPSPTRALMKKRREMIENKNHIEYVDICKTITKKARVDIRKHNLDETREPIVKGQKNTQPRGKPDDNTTGQTRQIYPRAR